MFSRSIIAAILLAPIGFNFFNIMPLFLGAAANEFGWNESRLGYLAAAEMAGMALSSLTALIWIHRVVWYRAAQIGVLVIVVGNLVTFWVQNYELLLAVRAATGIFGDGVCTVIAMVVLGEADKPERTFGANMVAVVIISSLNFYLIPHLTPLWGLKAVAGVIMLQALIILPLVRWIPEHTKQVASHPDTVLSRPRSVALRGLSVVLVWYIGIGAFWAFVERMAVTANLLAEDTGTILSIGVLSGLVGGILAMWLADRAGRVWPFALTLLIHCMVVLILIGEFTATTFLSAMVCFNILWTFGTAYIFGLIGTADFDGRAMVLIPVFIAAGSSIGPAIGGEIAANTHLAGVNFFAAALCVICMLVYLPFALRVTRQNIYDEKECMSEKADPGQ